MKSIAVTKDYRPEIVEVPYPKLLDDCVITKTLSCGVCNGTDMKIIHGKFKGMNKYPLLLGHEAIGEVVEVGKNVKQWKKGDWITLPFMEGKDEQDRYAGYYNGWCAYSEYTMARDWMAMAEAGNGPGTPDFWDGYYTQKIFPKDMDPVIGSMCLTFREVLAAIRGFGFSSGDSIVIFGAGPVGLTYTRMCKLLGLGPVIVTDILPEKEKEAAQQGADFFINGSGTNVVEEVRRILPNGADHVVDAVGVNAIINTAMELIKDNGQICVYGISPNLGTALDWSKAPYNWSLKFSQFPIKKAEADAHDQVMNWVRLGALNPEDFVSHVLPFENALDAFDMLEKKVPCKKIVIDYTS